MSARRRIAAGVLAAALLLAAIATGTTLLREEMPPGVGVDAPEFRAVSLDDPPVTRTMADYRGKVVLLNIWATWCAPCRVEMPSMELLHRAYADRGLAIVAVSVDDPGSLPQIRSFVKEYGLTFEVLHDPDGPHGRLTRNYQTAGYPETVIVGRDGIIRRKMLGARDWSSRENRAVIERLLGEQSG